MRTRLTLLLSFLVFGCAREGAQRVREDDYGSARMRIDAGDTPYPSAPSVRPLRDAGVAGRAAPPIMREHDAAAGDVGASYGMLLITELMIDPAEHSDTAGEWIELYNPAAEPRSLAGCSIGDGGGGRPIDEPVVVGARDYATIASSADPGFIPTIVGALSLPNASGVVELRCGETVIDRVVYDEAAGFPIRSGAAAALDPTHFDVDGNDAPSAWCAAVSEFARDLGTPGAANSPCAKTAGDGQAGSAASGPAIMSRPRPMAGEEDGEEPEPMQPSGAGTAAPQPMAAAVPYGALVISELMPDPSARTDAEAEWVELYNASEHAIDLGACSIGDGEAEPRALGEALRLPPGGYAAIASSENSGFPAELTASLSLTNGADVVEVHCGGTLIDRVAYDRAQGFPIVSGAAAALDPARLDADENDVAAAWCAATTVFADDRGTPGAANSPCGGGAPVSEPEQPAEPSRPAPESNSESPQPAGSEPPVTAPVLPYGAVLITELMPDPDARSDADGEWIELYNATAQAIDLAGCTIGDGSASPREIDGPLRIDARAYGTIANGDSPGFRPTIELTMSLANGADAVEVRCGDTLIDRVAYDRAGGFPLAAGAALSLDSARLDADRNDTPQAWCSATQVYATDRGTPGAANPRCEAAVPEVEAAPEPEPEPGPAPDEPSEAPAEPTAPSLAYGAVLITEVMADPSARSDAQGEWLELHNASSQSIDLAGCAVGDGAAEPRPIASSLRIEPGGYVTLANGPAPGFQANAVIELSLRNEADVLELYCGSALIDRVAYDAAQSFPIATGASASLDPGRFDADDNDQPSAWCVSARAFAGDYGTPGSANPACESASEPEAGPMPQPTSEPPSASQPQEPIPQSGPEGDPAAEADAESTPQDAAPQSENEPASQPTSESIPEAESETTPQDAAPQPESEPASQPTSEPTAEAESESRPEDSAAAPEIEPDVELTPEPEPEPEPPPERQSNTQTQAELAPEPPPEAQTQDSPQPEPEPTSQSDAPQPLPHPDLEPEQDPSLTAAPDPVAEQLPVSPPAAVAAESPERDQPPPT